jgi:hypothetical protein
LSTKIYTFFGILFNNRKEVPNPKEMKIAESISKHCFFVCSDSGIQQKITVNVMAIQMIAGLFAVLNCLVYLFILTTLLLSPYFYNYYYISQKPEVNRNVNILQSALHTASIFWGTKKGPKTIWHHFGSRNIFRFINKVIINHRLCFCAYLSVSSSIHHKLE